MDSISVGLLGCSAIEKRENHELRQYIRKLEFNNYILKAQQDLSQDGILIVDDQWNMISFNERFMDMWKIPPLFSSPVMTKKVSRRFLTI